MKYLRYGFLSISKNVIFTIIMVLEVVALLLTTNIVVASINYKEVLKKPFDNIISKNGYYCSFEPMHETPEEYYEFYGLFDKFKSAEVVFSKALGSTEVIDDEIFFKYNMPLKSGCWPSQAKDDHGRPYAVISPDYLKEPGDIINVEGIGDVVVSGVLTDVTYVPYFGSDCEDVTSFYLSVDYEKTIEEIESGDVSDFTYCNQTQIIASSSTKEENSQGLSCFIFYDDDISDEDIKYNETVMEEIINYKEGDDMYPTSPKFDELSTINENSNKAIAETYYQLIPIVLVVAAVVLIGIIGSVAINTVSQVKNYGIYYLCGSKWSDCMKISFANISIILVFAGVLSALLLYIAQSFNLNYLIGQIYDWNNLIISVGMIIGMIVLALIIPFGIIRFTSPVEVVKSEK